MRSIVEKGSAKSLLYAVLIWTLAASALSFLASILIRCASIPSAYWGYVASALSFLAACAAGGAYRSKAGSVGWPGLLLCGFFLSLALLTAGVLIAGDRMSASGILSVASFSVAGCLFSGLFRRSFKRETKRSEFAKKRKR